MSSAVTHEIAACQCPRIARVCAEVTSVERAVSKLVNLAVAGLPLMLRPDHRYFGYTRRRNSRGEIRLEGISHRYGAIVLLGVMRLPMDMQREVLGGATACEFLSRLMEVAGSSLNLGDAALLAWVAAELHHPGLAQALQNLRRLSAGTGNAYVVELAWAVSALSAAKDHADVALDIRRFRDRLLGAFNHNGGLFPHEIDSGGKNWYRSHVGCFADQVYPIQALARLHRAVGDSESLATANYCARQICRAQGPRGQWWWHYDVRSGSVIEGYPVYSVHQHSMAPMALMDLHEAGGADHSDAIRLGLGWIICAPEIDRSLIDEDHQLIWRKVGRIEPWKTSRAVRTLVSTCFKSSRLRWMDRAFPARAVDFECRPYELGWMLYAWLGERK